MREIGKYELMQYSVRTEITMSVEMGCLLYLRIQARTVGGNN